MVAIRVVDQVASDVPQVAEAPGPTDRAEDRWLDIDRAKGFGIALVVWGHIATGATPDSPDWFNLSIAAIYAFHMPFFMYLSGFVYFLIKAPDRFWTAPAGFVGKRFDRLIVPFLLFSLLVIIGKYAFSSFGRIDDDVQGIGDGMVQVLTNAPGNPSLSTWYILVLFVYSVLTPLLWRVSGRRIWPLLLLGAIGWVWALPEDFYIRRIAQFYIFFVLGGAFAVHRERVLPILQRFWLPLLIAFAVICALTLKTEYTLLVCGLACIPGLHGLFRQRFLDGDRLLLFLGRSSMAIYLLNTMGIGVAKLIYLHFLPYRGEWFVLYAGILFATGMIGPIVARWLIGRIPPLRPVARYLD